MSCHKKCKEFPITRPQSDFGKIQLDYRYITMSKRLGLQKLKDELLSEGRSTASIMTNIKANNDLSLKRIDRYQMPPLGQNINRFTTTFNQKW